MANSLESVLISAETIGYPVVLKTAMPNVTHKSDVGGIHLNLADADTVANAYKTLAENIGERPSAAQTWFSALPAAWHSTSWVTDEARAFLNSHDQSEPFCAWMSYPNPHHSLDCPRP